MIKYNPEKELTKEEMSKLDFDVFLDYLDQKAEHLKQFSRPLNRTETRKIATLESAQRGETLTKEKFDRIKAIAQENDDKLHKEVEDKLKFKDSNITFSKKNRK